MTNSPLAACPACGNSEDTTIEISAVCVALIESGDQFDYVNCHISPSSKACCTVCGHKSAYSDFKLSLRPTN